MSLLDAKKPIYDIKFLEGNLNEREDVMGRSVLLIGANLIQQLRANRAAIDNARAAVEVIAQTKIADLEKRNLEKRGDELLRKIEQVDILERRADELLRKLEQIDTRTACRARVWAYTDTLQFSFEKGTQLFKTCPHTVRAGETPSIIARKYSISETLLRNQNKGDIKGDRITAEFLLIPLPVVFGTLEADAI